MMKTTLTSKHSSLTIAILLTVLLLLSLIPFSGSTLLEAGIGKAGVDQVNSSARTYIETQREQAMKGFLVLSALKVGLAVLRSSEVGLVLNVRIGDLAVAVYDYVNFAWKVLLAAVAWFYLADFFLDLSGRLDIWFLWGALLCFSVLCWMAFFKSNIGTMKVLLKRTGAVAAVLCFILYLALPLCLVGAGWVSANITGAAIEDANTFMEDLRDDMPSLLGNGNEESSSPATVRTPSVTVPFPYDGKDPSQVVIENGGDESRFSRMAASLVPVEKVREFGKYLERKSKELASIVLRQTAAYLFNIVVLPLLMVFILYVGGRFAVSLVSAASWKAQS